jgi:hypothetical protein
MADENSQSQDVELEKIMESATAENNLRNKLEELLGPAHYVIGKKIKAGIHAVEDVYEYHKGIKALLLEGRSPNADIPGGYVYSELVSDVAGLIVSDFEAGLIKGKTYRRAVERYLKIAEEGVTERNIGHFLSAVCSDFRRALHGRDLEAEMPFPELLTDLWGLKMLRPVTYSYSLDAMKWIQLIVCTINAVNAQNKDIKAHVDKRKMFMSGVMNYGMLHPKMPLIEYSDKPISDKEAAMLKEHGQVGLVMLKENGMPRSPYLLSVVGSHNLPLDIISGIAAVGEQFEAMYFRRRYRKERLGPLEVFRRMGINLFGEAQLKGILENLRKRGYRYTAEEAKNPLRQPYQVLGLVFGILEHLEYKP